jgi:hypothetical protein
MVMPQRAMVFSCFDNFSLNNCPTVGTVFQLILSQMAYKHGEGKRTIRLQSGKLPNAMFYLRQMIYGNGFLVCLSSSLAFNG